MKGHVNLKIMVIKLFRRNYARDLISILYPSINIKCLNDTDHFRKIE